MNSGQGSTFSFSSLSHNNQFGSNQQTSSFGNTKNPSQQNSFGNMNTGNAFGGNTNAFGQNNGGNSTNSGNTGFGQTNQNGNSSFGNTSLGKPSGNGASTGFGNLSTGNSFATTGMNSNGGSSFGNNQNISGNSANNKSNSTGFGGFGIGKSSGLTQGGSNLQNGFGGNNSSNTTTGNGASWGGMGNQKTPNLVPLKSKNLKIGEKHLVQCILNLDQNANMSKNELRIHYLTNGATPTKLNTQSNFQQNTSLPQNTTPTFGQTPNPPTTTSNSSSTFSFGGTFNNNTNTQTSGMFSGQSNNKTTGLGMFGASNGTGTGFSFPQSNPIQGASSSSNSHPPTTGNFGGNTFGVNPGNASGQSWSQPSQAVSSNSMGNQALGNPNQGFSYENLLSGLLTMMKNQQSQLSEGNTPFDEILKKCRNEEDISNDDPSTKSHLTQELSNPKRENGLYGTNIFAKYSSLPETSFSAPAGLEIEHYYEELEKKQAAYQQQNLKQKKKFIFKDAKPNQKKSLGNSSILQKNNLDFFQEDFDRLRDQVAKEISTKEQDLPDFGNFVVTPSINSLKEKTPTELRRVSQVTIENDYGKISFLVPINLYRKKFSECIEIIQDSIDISDADWDNKKCELTFKNFGEYKELGSESEKLKLQKKIRKWVSRKKMSTKQFDQATGNLTVFPEE